MACWLQECPPELLPENVTSCFSMIMRGRPHVARIYAQFLEAENVPILPLPAYSPDMSPIEHVWDTLDWCVLQHVPVPANIQQLYTDNEEEWDNIPQATINSLINSMQRRFVVLHGAIGGHTRYWLVFWSVPLPIFLKVSVTNRFIQYLYSQSCEIHTLGLNEFISIDQFPSMNCNSVNSLKFQHVAFIFLFSIF